jgi:Na+/melibiose symporter-like transporter
MSSGPATVPPPASIWGNRDFVRLWSAGTISVFGSLITRTALPFAAIILLGAGPLEIAGLRSLELVAALVVGLVAGAWVDRLRRRPIMIVADLGRALLLGSIPVAAVAGVLGVGQLFVVAFLAAILTTFFDLADRSYLPSLVDKRQLVAANGALTASASAAEFSAFGISGFLIQLFSAPAAIAVDAVSFVLSAGFIGTIRRPEPPRPPTADREPVLREIREGLGLVARSPVLRAIAGASAAAHVLWGVFGTAYLLFATREVGLGPAAIGVIAGLGGAGSLVGALLAERTARRLGLGRTLLLGMIGFTVGSAFVPLAPAGAVALGAACLIAQQLVADGAGTIYDVVEISLRQSIVEDRLIGRVNGTIRFFTVLFQLAATIAGGLIAQSLGLRTAMAVGVLGGVVAIACIWFSPIRTMTAVPPPTTEALLPGEQLPLTE